MRYDLVPETFFLSHGILFYRFPTISLDFHADVGPGVPSLEDTVRYLFAAHLFGQRQRSDTRIVSFDPCGHIMLCCIVLLIDSSGMQHHVAPQRNVMPRHIDSSVSRMHIALRISLCETRGA
jgi:hypothetical protein